MEETTICLTCGDSGWDVALIYCDECQELAIHRYCLPEIPKTFDEYVVWHCDDCKPELPLSNGVEETVSISTDDPSDDLPLVDLIKSNKKRLKKTPINKKMKKAMLDNDNDPKKQDTPLSTGNTKCPEIQIGDGESEVEEEPVPTVENEVDDVVVTPYSDSYVPAMPIIDPIWRGCLKVSNGQGYSCRVWAHVSCLACSKVSEEAQLLPEILSSALHPRVEVWPKKFEQGCLNDYSIALYLLPESESDEIVVKKLIREMIHHDSALRATVTHAELLVFPSTKLPMRLWRFQKKLYLWGVFRAKQGSSEGLNPTSPHAEVVNN